MAVDWTLGLLIPVIIAGPLYYVNQGARFQILGGFGCASVQYPSILPILTTSLYTILPPLVSPVFYYPRVIAVFCHQYKEVNRFLQSNDTISRRHYFRILVLASIDVVVTLPLGAISLALFLIPATRDDGDIDVTNITFYPGWHFLHTNWGPTGTTYDEMKAAGNLRLPQLYFSYWTGPLLAFVVFGLFGLTREARASYWHSMSAVRRFLGVGPGDRPKTPALASSSPMRFHGQPQVCDIELQPVRQRVLSNIPNSVPFEGQRTEQDKEDTERIIAEEGVDGL